MRRTLLFLTVPCLALVFQCRTSDSSNQAKEEKVPEEISYNFDIRPILSDKCLVCHGPDANKREAGLRLDVAESAFQALKENPKAHALVAGKPEFSQAYLRITSKDTALLMPPPSSNLKLTQHEINLIEKWIKQGAKYEKHWAFVAPKKPSVPKVEQEEWPKNEIDYFVLQKQEQKGLKPNEEADKERLLKRLSLDLNGLPPSLQMMDEFLADNSPKAYEKMVDKLLKNTAYGEKMAIHWLDLARYADSHGYQDDGYRTQWPWRDWVIHAFNQNMHYNDFVTWQLAGDLMPNSTKEQLLATGFNRNHKITEEGGVIPEEYRIMYVTDRNDLFGKGLLGVTLECAHCHDHKYDPFSQKEYYQMFAFFNNVKEVGIESVIGGPETYAKKPLMEISNEDVKNILTFVNKQDTSRLIVSVMGDLDTTRKTYILKRGVYDAPGDEVEPGTPKSILPFNNKYPKNRLGLSQWLFDKKNPLTARVYVNILWQEFFGKGIVKTSGDFGMQGELPSHPALLDWLASDFMEHNWDVKRLVKQMVTSATYRQSAVITKEKLAMDPDNILLARGARYRINAEFIKDLVLSSSGLLNKTIGGPSVKPYQPAGLWEGATSGRGLLSVYNQDHGASLYRRGMYTLIKRTVPPPTMGIFDASNRDLCEVKRLKTNTPLQALVMMNDPTVLEASRVLAAKLLQEKTDAKEKVAKAFRLIVCRKPSDKELGVLTAYYDKQLKTMKPETAQKMIAVGEYPLTKNVDKKTLAALMRVVSTIYNLEETITKS
ncbi:PSD1 and planctomycete cytochrome C domain-containing protein [Dyadobacter sp. LHD-138]|uniref:PSD1 and planctomycete cytochrome C domain-containing protein n=1 Tax=Dyadobacter sp. LHD-138 TaxID=3071413 RepID=UPI0027E0F9EE|nr:PSD1 and planctomycete cytochrome C domain-containing protein [Dyadobacter sp. LHD-138]MDQ6481894.1 PSD1 and planctomycete cytochrome C domain-containing protein [Dyadobacter sp. LHD-138]